MVDWEFLNQVPIGCSQDPSVRRIPRLGDREECALRYNTRQLQSSTAVGDDAYKGMGDCFRKIIKNEG